MEYLQWSMLDHALVCPGLHLCLGSSACLVRVVQSFFVSLGSIDTMDAYVERNACAHLNVHIEIISDDIAGTELQNESMSYLLRELGPLHGFSAAGFDRGIMQTMVGFLFDVQAYQSVFDWAPRVECHGSLDVVLLHQFRHLALMFPKLTDLVLICFSFMLTLQACAEVLLNSHI